MNRIFKFQKFEYKPDSVHHVLYSGLYGYIGDG